MASMTASFIAPIASSLINAMSGHKIARAGKGQ